ncbi:MAG: murein biosynthesis integral membrane protein MurJ [Acidobacteriia bacterium]|nr:murein biosynthesis integral membrane protein MurJ [Terriglobia bacterium]
MAKVAGEGNGGALAQGLNRATVAPPTRPGGSGRNAVLVATGIALSRGIGLVRERVFSHYFGLSDAGDAFKAAFKIPNLLQNLFGEGVLSASFIPVYSAELAGGDQEEADRVAGAVLALLSLAVAIIVLAGVLLTPWLIAAIAPGFTGVKRALAIRLVRILFPGAGLLVLSAWCLGILNSHRRFFLSYTAPVGWNLAMIATLVWLGQSIGEYPLAEALAWGSVAGSALQLGVQLPTVMRLLGQLRLSLGRGDARVRTVVTNFLPAFLGRGVVQVSAYVDTLLASFLPAGAVTALANAQTLYTLPVSLFGMSVSAAELPEMSSALGSEAEVAAELRLRLATGLERIAFLVVPSAVAFLALGDIVTSVVYQSGRFSRADSVYVWGILGAAGIGLLATTMARLYSSSFYALRDTKTPLRFAVARVLVGTALGAVLAFLAPGWLGIPPRWGAAGIALASATAGWVEFALLRRALGRRIGRAGLGASLALRLWAAAAVGAALAWGAKLGLGVSRPLLLGAVSLPLFGGGYLAAAAALRVAQATSILERALRARGRDQRPD